MKETLVRRYLYLGSSLLLALYLLAPSYWTNMDPPQEPPPFFISKGLRLGLDLKGGIHLTLQVDVEEALRKRAESEAVSWTSQFEKEDIPYARDPAVSVEDEVSVTRFFFSSPEERDRARRYMEEHDSTINLEIEDPEPGADPALYTLVERGNPQTAEYLRKNAVTRALEILRGRIDQFGVAEPILIPEGEDRIVIQLPGLKDEKKALELIGTTAQLEFKMVHDKNDQLKLWIEEARRQGLLGANPTEEDYRRALKDKIPDDAELGFRLLIRDEAYEDGEELAKLPPEPILLRSRLEMTGEAVVDARVAYDHQTNEPYVSLSLSPTAARKFDELTAKNIHKQLAIILDGKVKSDPVIQSRISGGQVSITGNFTVDEAEVLAMVLRSGALPAPIKVIQNITVGPTLGADSIRAGLISAIIGFLFVALFMAYYYRLSGVIADAALLLNNILLLGALAFFDATLTLPGIAGIVLSMGMAVDSNVLIFERIREELDMGRPIPPSIRAGFDKAWWTIIDSHVTTLITALVLFNFGTGPIKGFAVTLSIGVLLNLFTALVGTRVVYDHLLLKSKIKRLKFRQLIRKPSLDFVTARKPAFVVSSLFVLAGIVAFVQVNRGEGNLGIDFAGGTMMTISVSEPISMAEARSTLRDGGFEDAQVQAVGDKGHFMIRLRKAEDEPGQLTDKVLTAYQKAFPDRTFTIEGTTVIGSAVSRDLRNTSIMAVIISLIGIIGYLALRFDFRFGVAAAIATFHDVLTVLAFFYVTGKQIDLLLVTALLTLAGYSLTDTVVVFDRIRETRNRHPAMHIKDVINVSVNDVLSRTLITSLTVLFVLICLFFLGGAVLHEFSLALILGVTVGNYSSVFVASPILYEWEMRRGRLMPDGKVVKPTRKTAEAAGRAG